MIISNGDVIPGDRVGFYRLGMSVNVIKNMIGEAYLYQRRENGIYVLSVENANFFFDNHNELFQIGVTKGFRGKLDGCIGIGNTMKDVKNKYGNIYEEYGDFLVQNLNGIAFGLEDLDEEDDWDELSAPIEWIFVYKHHN